MLAKQGRWGQLWAGGNRHGQCGQVGTSTDGDTQNGRAQCQHIGRAWKDVAGVKKCVHSEWTVGAGVDSVA